MNDQQKEDRVQEIYATPEAELTDDDTAEFFAIMFGGVSPST